MTIISLKFLMELEKNCIKGHHNKATMYKDDLEKDSIEKIKTVNGLNLKGDPDPICKAILF